MMRLGGTVKLAFEAGAAVLARPMPTSIDRMWPDALWIGVVDQADLRSGGRVHLEAGEGYRRARLLIQDARTPLGFVEVGVTDSAVMVDDILAAARALPAVSSGRPVAGGVDPMSVEPISVVVCTRRRPEMLRVAIASLLAIDYPVYEIVVVNNDPADSATADVIGEFCSPRLSLVDAWLPGLARARNVGIRASKYDIVAFTDDDVIVDEGWLRGIADGFVSKSGVGCVTGMVASGEINSREQWYFDKRVSWASNCTPTTYALRTPPVGDPLFPFRVASYGTGANFALHKSLVMELGGFDEGLGAGSPTGGGEDIDMFVRVLLAGHDLTYRPDALIWHRHRSDMLALTQQTREYGRGLGAWLTKITLNPSTGTKALKRGVAGLRHVRSMTNVESVEQTATAFAGLGRGERIGVMTGPFLLAKSRMQGRKSRPLTRER
jgi:glycosyltransferase involved in cell wall biosynthesis